MAPSKEHRPGSFALSARLADLAADVLAVEVKLTRWRDALRQAASMKALTVRNLPSEVADALEREKRRRGKSLNQTVIELLAQGLGIGHPRSNGLARLAGRWSLEEFQEFEDAVADFRAVDPELWR